MIAGEEDMSTKRVLALQDEAGQGAAGQGAAGQAAALQTRGIDEPVDQRAQVVLVWGSSLFGQARRDPRVTHSAACSK
ncbi:hypothetical protein QFZ75_006566 [Streptomyces sp. V3I8]|uniref:hypothetical protein n=1 Tax=Streptomyces sp. V3I8 TaxID=3042279 RepID=UPI002787403D|nr:hypothetical protein [Streptomyces sp. V3I8]MDQ1040150.1 hypothetical protein [Streptomyces sp. V3I8]